MSLNCFFVNSVRENTYFLFYFAFVKVPSDSADFLRRHQVAGTGRSSLDDGSSTGLQHFLEPLKSQLKSKPRILLHRDLHHRGPPDVRL